MRRRGEAAEALRRPHPTLAPLTRGELTRRGELEDSLVATTRDGSLGVARRHPGNVLLGACTTSGNLLVEMPIIRAGSSVGFENVCSPSRAFGEVDDGARLQSLLALRDVDAGPSAEHARILFSCRRAAG